MFASLGVYPTGCRRKVWPNRLTPGCGYGGHRAGNTLLLDADGPIPRNQPVEKAAGIEPAASPRGTGSLNLVPVDLRSTLKVPFNPWASCVLALPTHFSGATLPVVPSYSPLLGYWPAAAAPCPQPRYCLPGRIHEAPWMSRIQRWVLAGDSLELPSRPEDQGSALELLHQIPPGLSRGQYVD